ncbi:MAG: DUF1822 family protein [Oscillatoriales cyanobacterium C42_A2020_001]|nr:DUF1822 family protein [Leptolyngbyaceae cyanobacterium C42_A2020_001]
MVGLETAQQQLEISPALQQQAWHETHAIAIPGLRWQAYLNQVCLHTIGPWLEERTGTPPAISFPTTPGLWSLVNGSALTLGNRRIVVIPGEAMDHEELRVPQEWIDHPAWLGDYYLAVEVDVDAESLYVWGYSTHHTIKTQGVFDSSDLTYCLDSSAVIQDMTVFWVTQHLPPEPTRMEVPPLPTLTADQVGTLLRDLQDPAIALPRLEVSTGEWLGLMSQEHWLRQLEEPRRQGDRSSASTPIQLGQWLQNLFEVGWQTLEEAFQRDSEMAVNLRQQPIPPDSGLTRVKTIALDADWQMVRLALTVAPELDGRRRITVQLFPAAGATYLPTDLQLSLKTLSDEVIQAVNASSESHYLQLRPFKCASGREFRLYIQIGDRAIMETIVA